MKVGRLEIRIIPREPSGLRHLVDGVYRFAHELIVSRIQQRSEFGTCPHGVDRIWNRFFYPVVNALEVPWRDFPGVCGLCGVERDAVAMDVGYSETICPCCKEVGACEHSSTVRVVA